MTDMTWWQELLLRATDDQLEQAVSGLRNEVRGVAPVTEGDRILNAMHHLAVAELGKRSRVTPMPAPMNKPAVKIQMRWTRHGHWCGEGEPNEDDLRARPGLVARCGGPGMCPECAMDAAQFKNA